MPSKYKNTVLSVVRKELIAGGTTQPETGGAEVVTLWLLKVMPKAAELAQNTNARKNLPKVRGAKFHRRSISNFSQNLGALPVASGFPD